MQQFWLLKLDLGEKVGYVIVGNMVENNKGS